MGKKASAPPAPDPAKLAEEQAKQNRITQFLPGGSGLFFGTVTPGIMVGNGFPSSNVGTPLPSASQTDYGRLTRTEDGYRSDAGEYYATLPEGYIPSVQNTFIPGTPAPQQTTAPANVMDMGGGLGFQPSTGGAALRVQEGPFDEMQRLARETIASRLASRAIQQVGNLPLDPISFEGLAGLPGVGDFGAERGRVEDALFTRARGLLDPVFDQREAALMQSLSNRGVPEGGELYNTQVGNFGRERNEAYTNAALDAVRAGGQEQNRLFGLASSARNQGLQELLTQRQLAFNELASLLGGQQLQPTVQLQNFIPPAQIDVMGPAQMAQNSALAGFNARQQAQQGFQAGLFGLGSAAILACSRDFKTNGRPVEVILPRVRALKVEAWDYKPGVEDGGTHIGPYAEDFHALFGVGDGKHIHVVDAFGVCLLAIKELDAKVRELANG